MNNDVDPSLDLYVKAALGRKALKVVVLDVRELTSVADVFIICSGRSNRQVTAIAEHIQTDLKKHRIRPLSVEGKNEGHWVLLDYGHVVWSNIYLDNPDNLGVFNKVYSEFFDYGNEPARVTVICEGIPGGNHVEVTCFATTNLSERRLVPLVLPS